MAGRSDEGVAGVPNRRPRGSRRQWSPTVGGWSGLLLCLPLLVLLAAFVLYPLVKLTIDSFTAGDGLSNYSEALGSSGVRRALVTTLLASLAVTVLAVGMASLLAWYLRSVRRPWVRGVLWIAVLAPFWMGTVIKNYSLLLLLGRDGALNDFLGIFGIGPIEMLYKSGTVIFGIAYTMVPYAVFAMYSVLRSIDDSLIAAAEGMGATRLGALRTVVVPLALPGIVASSALVFAISVGFYVTPVLLGGGKVPFMANVIQDNLFTYFNYPKATAASMLLIVIAFAVVGIALRAVGRERLMRAMA
ncbi:MAG: putative spermidine/putrescine transport system permease protein [Thermoleophilaceae bacterium]|nr:putative spermidine/putrescine transport system permease protein [Thermoleophilaceae bacterium]